MKRTRARVEYTAKHTQSAPFPGRPFADVVVAAPALKPLSGRGFLIKRTCTNYCHRLFWGKKKGENV